MSYLVDALRKAENERRQGVAPDVVALSARLPQGQRAGPGLIGWVIGVLVVCNLLLFGYLFWPQSQQTVASEHGVPMAAADTEKPVSSAPTAAAQSSARTVAVASTTTAPVRNAPVSETTQVQPVQSAIAGQVQPLASQSTPAAAKPYAGPVPNVVVQGHLFSNDPSESFILVNGHIYHEGQRLPDGVAVVRIDRTGALLNYRGRRFHVDGPG